MLENIIIKGASQHNLRNIDLEIPRNSFTVITGLSGSGKSSLAFDTLYAEGQRRYVESLSAYARQFLDRLQKPKVERIDGLSPAIAIEQRTAGASPRSTVATVTEIYDYLRLLYAHTGVPHCPECGRELTPQSAEKMVETLTLLPDGTRYMLLAPVISGRKGEHRDVIDKLRSDGFVRARIDGKVLGLEDDDIELEKNIRHNIEAVVDRLVAGNMDRTRLTDSVETALKYGNGELIASVCLEDGTWQDRIMSEKLACIHCRKSFGELLPRNFSFNTPYGACPECNGLGVRMVMDENLVVPDRSKSLRNGAIPAWRRGARHLIMYYNLLLRKIIEQFGKPEYMTVPFEKLPADFQKLLLYGSGDKLLEFDYSIKGKRYHWAKSFEGVLENLRRRYVETESDSVRERLGKLLAPRRCDVCHGDRLNPVTLAVTVGGLNIADFNRMSVVEALAFIRDLQLPEEKAVIVKDVRQEIASRLKFLADVGLEYLTLDRPSGTLSGGEAQRIRLATQLGSSLTGVLYILDEPSIGLHQKDNDLLIATLQKLRDLGNTVIVVEHDLDTMRAADYIVDLGPGAGEAGGRLVAAGTAEEVAAVDGSATGDFLSGRRCIPVPEQRNPGNGKRLKITGAAEHNLKNVDVEIPLGCFTCVTGVSGSGKSTLVNSILVRKINSYLGINDEPAGKHKKINGLEEISKMVVIDQTPIGRTPRSNPATYCGIFDLIRKLFSMTPDAKSRGYGPGRFSFNVKGGRCEECRGDGIKRIEMQFLSDVYVECSACGGKRFNKETLEVRYKKHNIADILELTVDEAVKFFEPVRPIARRLEMLRDVGLGYVRLGQPATTLSGGEAQRVKLACELAAIPKGHTLYVLDEPTTGLHPADVKQLLSVLNRLRDNGNSVLVIEHNLDVIKTADWIIDLGPEGGSGGGTVVAAGTPEDVSRNPGSYTGKYLAQELIGCSGLKKKGDKS